MLGGFQLPLQNSAHALPNTASVDLLRGRRHPPEPGAQDDVSRAESIGDITEHGGKLLWMSRLLVDRCLQAVNPYSDVDFESKYKLEMWLAFENGVWRDREG